MIIFTNAESPASHNPTNSDNNANEAMTIIVEPINSSLLGQETLPISNLISLKKLFIFAIN